MTPALATGHVDVATGAPSAGLFNSIASGAGFKIVADWMKTKVPVDKMVDLSFLP